MAIVQTEIILYGKSYTKTESNSGFYIQDENGNLTDVSYDFTNLERKFTETDIPIDDGTTDADKAEAFDILLGGAS